MTLTIPFNLQLLRGILIIFFIHKYIFSGWRFSITSAVFGGIIIVFYSVTLSLITSSDADSYYDDYESYKRYHQGKVVILAFMLFLGMTTFGIGIWAAICICLLKPCCQQPQVK